MIESRWHRMVARWLVGRMPTGRRDHVVGDLFEDFHERRRRMGRTRAEWWLLTEAWSLGRAYQQAARSPSVRTSPRRFRQALRSIEFRVALQSLRRSPLFVLAAALTLAVGIAAVLGVAGFVDAILLRPISQTEPAALFRVTSTTKAGRDVLQFSYPEVSFIRSFIDDAADVAAASLSPVLIRVDRTVYQSLAEVVTGKYFGVLVLSPAAGRLLTDTDDTAAAPPVVVISDRLWTTRFARSPSALGATIHLNGAPFTIIGVAPAAGAVTFVAASIDVWVPLHPAASLLNRGWETRRETRFLALIGRLRPGVSRQRLATSVTTASAQLVTTFPDTRADSRLVLGDGRLLVGSQRRAAAGVAGLLVVLAVLVFAVVCANVGNLFTARWMALRRSVAVRLSLGAPSSTIVGQALVEGAAIGLLAGVLGAAAYWALREQLASVAVLPTLTLRLDLLFDRHLVAETMALAIATGMVLTLFPAWGLARVDVVRTLRDASGTLWGGRTTSRSRRTLVAAQVGLSLLLVMTATLLTRSVGALRAADLGFDVDRLAIVDLDVEPPVAPASLPVLARDALVAVRALADVASATMASGAPVNPSAPMVDVSAAGGGAAVAGATAFRVTTAYFETVGVPIVTGRAFDDTDRPGDVAIVNEVLASRLAGAGTVGRMIEIAPGGPVRVIGIAKNSRYHTVSETPQPHVYLLTTPHFHLSIIARARTAPGPLLPELQRALDGVGPGIQGFFPRTGRDDLQFDLLPAEIGGSAARRVSGVAVALSALGLYGLVAWLVELRRSEFGLRLALGATSADLQRLVFSHAIRSAAPGFLLGLPAAVGLAYFLRGMIFGVGVLDPVALVAATGAVGVIVGGAAWLPARRAARTDPLALLRSS